MGTLKEYVAAVLRDIREGAEGHTANYGGADPPKVRFRVGVTRRDDGETTLTSENSVGSGVVEFELPIRWPES